MIIFITISNRIFISRHSVDFCLGEWRDRIFVISLELWKGITRKAK